MAESLSIKPGQIVDLPDPESITMLHSGENVIGHQAKWKIEWPDDAVDEKGKSKHWVVGRHHCYNPNHVNCYSCESRETSIAALNRSRHCSIQLYLADYNKLIAKINKEHNSFWKRLFWLNHNKQIRQAKLDQAQTNFIQCCKNIDKVIDDKIAEIDHPANTKGVVYKYDYYSKTFVPLSKYENYEDFLKEYVSLQEQLKNSIEYETQKQQAILQQANNQLQNNYGSLFGAALGNASGLAGNIGSALGNAYSVPNSFPNSDYISGSAGSGYTPSVSVPWTKQETVPTPPETPVVEITGKRKFK